MAAIDNLFKQIIGQNTASQWTGEGYGGAEANAKAMAKLLADAGITDIKQFGKVDKYEPVTVTGYTLNGNTVQNPSKGKYYEMVYEGDSENGPQYRRRDLTPQEIAQVKPVYGIEEYDSEGMRSVRTPTSVVEKDGKMMGVYGTTYGNKATGQAIESGTGRWRKQGGEDLFGGTGEGEGNTAFRVQMSADGTPVFYTTKGSSSDVANIMPLIQFGLAATGAGGLLGNSLLGAGASKIATGALGNAILGGVTSSLAGGNALKGALLGGAGGALGGYLQGGSIDASNMTSAQFNDALESQLIGEMQRSGLTNAQITQFLENASPADIASITSALPVTNASDNLLVNAAKTPITSDALINTLSQVPTVAVTAKAPEKVSPDVLSSVTSMLSGATTTPPTIEITAKNPNQSDNSATIPIITSPITTNLPPTQTTGGTTGGTVGGTVGGTTGGNKSLTGNLTISDVIKLLGIGTTIAGINAATSGGGGGGGGGGVTNYPIVPVPTNWKSPPPTGVAKFTPLTPIDFGSKDLLKGTQWEKFLDPNYNKAPAVPNVPTNPSNMSFNQLMGVLGNTSTSMPTQNVSINDVIAGIQSQYGQTPTGSVG